MGLLDQNNYAGYAQEGQRLAVEPMSFTPMDAARFVAEATPIIGDAMAAKEVYDELQKPDPNYALVAALGGAALVGLVPGLGDAMAAGIKKGARGLLDTAKRIEVDPNALGMSGGNIRLKQNANPEGYVKPTAAELRREANIQKFGYDPNEVSQTVDTSYRGGHQPRGPQSENPVRLDDITKSVTGESGGYPSEFYGPNGAKYYAPGPRFSGDEYGMANKESYSAIIKAKGSPDAEVTMYRAVPNEDSITSINEGDFVTLSPTYAKLHGAEGYGPRGDGAGKVISQKVKVKDLYFAGDDVNEFGYFPDKGNTVTPSLPAPRNEAEAMAKKVLEMRASGNARDVTEKMMDAADDQYMFKNTPIPMDVSSRMARADQMNPRKGFHGTNADIKGFEGNVFSTDNPTLASTYARGISDGQIYPLRLGSKFGDTIVEGAGADWHKMNISDIKDPSVQSWLDWAEGQKISTREIENAARKEGRSGVQFKNIKDTGPGINSSQFKNIGYTKEQERDLQRQYMKDLSNPSNVDVRLSPNLVRSQFARFDPEFKHLKNLTAAGLLAPGVLAAMQEYKKQQELERGLLSR
jgi:hypothetical protein